MNEESALMDSATRGAVLISGASSGIGLETTRVLAEAGFHVFAGVRSEEARAAIMEVVTQRVTPILLDVTRQQSIDDCTAAIADVTGDSGLDALINNAGIGIGGPLEYIALDELRRQFDVNVFGVAALTKALMPLLRQRGGRVVNVSSLAGRLAFPLVGPYTASKFALEAMSDCLRIELRRSGVRVVLVEPGFVVTPMHDKGLSADRAVFEALPEVGRGYYEMASEKRFETHEQLLKRGIAPRRVAEVIKAALLASKPKARYVVGVDARVFLALNRFLPQALKDRLLASITGL